VLRGAVLTENGTPIDGARVTWTPLGPRFERHYWLAVPWDEVRAATRSAVSGSDGRFEIELAGGDPLGRVDAAVWASKVGYEPGAVLVSAADNPAEERIVRCVAHPEQPVRVVDSDALPASGADVHVYGLVRLAQVADLDPGVARMRRVYWYDVTCDSDGRASVPGWRKEVQHVATRGAELSEPRASKADGVLELVLASGFEFDARVVLEAEASVTPKDAIQVARQDASGKWTWLGGYELRADGSCGPHRLPAVAATDWMFSLQAERLLTEETHVGSQRAGAHVHVALPGKAARLVAVSVHEEGDKPVQAAVVRAMWQSDGPEPQWVYSPSVLSDEHGKAAVPAPADRGVWLMANRFGYADVNLGPFGVSDKPIDVLMQPQCTLVGYVHHAGEPVANFRITHWLTDLNFPVVQDFKDREDGSFELPKLPQAPVHLYAVAPGYAQCAMVEVNMRGRDRGEVELELPTALRGRGRVIDANTRQPLDGVDVLVYTTLQFQMLTPSGSEVRTGPDGRFELSGFPPSYTSVYCLKSGYASQYAFAIGKPGEELEFGVIGMRTDDPYCVEFAPRAWSGLSVQSWRGIGAATIDGAVPDANGVSCVQGVKPGLLQMSVTYSDGSVVSCDHLIEPGPATQWTQTVGGPAAATLELRGLDAASCKLKPPLRLLLNYRMPEGNLAAREFVLGAGSSARLEGLVPGRQVLQLFDKGGLLARREISIEAVAEQTLELDIACDWRCLQVLDQAGEPLAQKRVSWRQAGEYYVAEDWQRCDGSGVFCIPASTTGTILLSTRESGLVVGQPVVLQADPQTRQVVRLEPLGDLVLRLVDAGVAQSGVTCLLEGVDPFYVHTVNATNEQGLVRWDGLRLAPVRLTVAGQGLWKQQTVHVPQPLPARTIDVPVYRVGDLELSVLNAAGLSVAGIPIDLVHVELGAGAAQWLQQQRIRCTSGGLGAGALVPGANGKLALQGLPRGSYTWSVALPNGAQSDGICEVVGGAAQQAFVSLP
jgi:hypothetical protein